MAYKVAYNGCFGGFCLSAEAVRRAKDIAGNDTLWSQVDESYGSASGIERHDPVLIQVIEELGQAASGSCANLQIEEIETDTYRIDEYDGSETVQTRDDIDWTVIK